MTARRIAVFWTAPPSHAFGLACLLANVATGAAAVLVDSSFSPRPFLDALDRSRTTVLHGSPSLFTSLLKAKLWLRLKSAPLVSLPAIATSRR